MSDNDKETFENFNIAVRTRDAMEKIAARVFRKMMPPPRFATVTALDFTNRRVTVEYPDEAGVTFTVPCATVMPVSTGQTVRINGPIGARYVDQVPSGQIQVSSLNIGVEGPTVKLADDFTDANTYKSSIDFPAATGSNDPGRIVHETSNGTDTNKGVLHLMPSDDNSDGDYVSIHGTNDPDTLKLHTSGKIEGVTTLTASGSITATGLIIAGTVDINAADIYLDSGRSLRWSNDDWLTYDDNNNRFTFRSDGSDATSTVRMGALELGGALYPTILASSGVIQVQSSTGYGTFGSGNTDFLHITTDRPQFYFNKPIICGSNSIGSYNGWFDLYDRNIIKARFTNDSLSRVIMNDNNAQGHGGNAFAVVTKGTGTGANGESASLILWTQYSTDRHVNLMLNQAAGDYLYVRNYENTAWIPAAASAWNIGSSRTTKERIRTGREEGGLLDYAIPGDRKLAFKQVRKLRPVLFDDKVQHEERKLDPDTGKVIERWNHHCDDEDCGGTNDRPCDLISRHVNRVGLIAEELDEVFPRAVSKDQRGDPIGIDYAVVTVELINEIQHILEDRDEARSREARNTLKIRALERENAQLRDQMDEVLARIAALENA